MTATMIFARHPDLAPSVEHEPREEDWLPILGPTAWVLGHHLYRELYAGVGQDQIAHEVPSLARRLGIGPSEAAHGPLPRAVDRLRIFGIVTVDADFTVRVRSRWGKPPKRREAYRHRPVPAGPQS